MPLFSDLAKSIGSYISKALAYRFRTTGETIKKGSGFSGWRDYYNNLKVRQEKSDRPDESEIPEKFPTIRNESFKKNMKTGIVRCYSSARLASDEKTSIPTGMRYARLLSMNACQRVPLLSSLFRLSKRWKCGRENCEDTCNWPLCPPGNTRWFQKPQMFNIYKAYWDERKDICCDDPCIWANPRFDDIYETRTCKKERIYQRTWWECPPRVVRKTVCCLNEAKPPEFCKRPKKERPPTACELPCDLGNYKCRVIEMPCCCPRRKNLRCRPLLRKELDCKRFCTPYPSFSECARSKLRTGPPKECRCLAPVGMCEYYNYWRYRFAHRTEGCV